MAFTGLVIILDEGWAVSTLNLYNLIVFANSVSANAPVGFVDYRRLTNAGGTVSGVGVIGGLCSVQSATCNSFDYGDATATLTGSGPTDSDSRFLTISKPVWAGDGFDAEAMMLSAIL